MHEMHEIEMHEVYFHYAAFITPVINKIYLYISIIIQAINKNEILCFINLPLKSLFLYKCASIWFKTTLSSIKRFVIHNRSANFLLYSETIYKQSLRPDRLHHHHQHIIINIFYSLLLNFIKI